MKQQINLSSLLPNEGQIEGLPANPRTIGDEQLNKLVNSLRDDPEMRELRELLVVAWGGKFVIVAGNMRYRAALALGLEVLPCKVLPPDTPAAKLRAYGIKSPDNHKMVKYYIFFNPPNFSAKKISSQSAMFRFFLIFAVGLHIFFVHKSHNFFAMKMLFNLLLIAAATLLMSASKPVDGCRCKNIPLHGRVQVVEHHADFEVQVVEHHADLHVQLVEHHADRCGLWQMVSHHPDFTVRFVSHHPDFTIRYVEHHPGLP